MTARNRLVSMVLDKLARHTELSRDLDPIISSGSSLRPALRALRTERTAVTIELWGLFRLLDVGGDGPHARAMVGFLKELICQVKDRGAATQDAASDLPEALGKLLRYAEDLRQQVTADGVPLPTELEQLLHVGRERYNETLRIQRQRKDLLGEGLAARLGHADHHLDSLGDIDEIGDVTVAPFDDLLERSEGLAKVGESIIERADAEVLVGGDAVEAAPSGGRHAADDTSSESQP